MTAAVNWLCSLCIQKEMLAPPPAEAKGDFPHELGFSVLEVQDPSKRKGRFHVSTVPKNESIIEDAHESDEIQSDSSMRAGDPLSVHTWSAAHTRQWMKKKVYVPF